LEIKKSVKVALLLENQTVAYWQYRIIQDLQALENVVFVAAIVNQGGVVKSRGPLVKLWHFKEKLVWKVHESLDQRLFRTKINPFKRVDISDLLNTLTVIPVRPRMTKFCDYLEEEDLAKIRPLQLDLALRFGFRIIKGEFLNIAKAGIWSFHHADNRENRGTPPGYWEVVRGAKLSGVTLQILQPELDGGIVLAKGISATHQLSIYRNKVQLYTRGIPFVKRRVLELQALGVDAFLQKYTTRTPDIYDRPLFLVPGNAMALRNLMHMVLKGVKDALSRVWYKNQWIIQYLPTQGLDISLRKATSLHPPRNAFWADPFGVRHEGRDFVFFEAYPYATKRGILAVVEFEKGKWKNYQVILDTPYHLSYPYLFQYNQEWYMLPETGANKKVSIYKCQDFPGKWEHHTDIMKNIVAIDSSIFEWDGKWWLFSTLEDEPGCAKNEALFLYYADTPFSKDWRLHPDSPIYTDVSKGRMAGRVFQWQNKLYRPAQDGSLGYGGAVKLFEITTLSETVYQEKEVTHIAANWDPKLFRTHTFDFNGDFLLVDALRKTRRFF
jgi:hypothetical protein